MKSQSNINQLRIDKIKNWVEKNYHNECNTTIGLHITYNYKIIKELNKL